MAVAQQDPARAKARVAVIAPVLGIPSEVWIERQCRFFTQVTPVLVGWSCHPSWTPPVDLETHLLPGVFSPPPGLFRRGLRKLGLAAARAIGPGQRREIAAALAALRADAVLCHFAWTAMHVAQAIPPGLPLIWHVHGRDVSALLRGRAYRAMLARQMPRAAALVAVGHHQLERLAPLGLPQRTAVIPCGAPLDLFARAPLPVQSAGGPLRFLSVGRMSAEKGMAESLQAFERIAGDFPHAELVLVGDGPDLDVLQQMAAASPFAARIRLPGRLLPEEVAREMAAAQVYLQHSREVEGWVEGFGVTLAEAGAAGLPLVASSLGGLAEQIEPGGNGWLFAPGDVEAQARLMRRLAADPVLRARFGARARALAARFDARRMTARLEAEILATLVPPRHPQ